MRAHYYSTKQDKFVFFIDFYTFVCSPQTTIFCEIIFLVIHTLD